MIRRRFNGANLPWRGVKKGEEVCAPGMGTVRLGSVAPLTPSKPDAPASPKVPLKTTLRRLYSLAWPERWPLALATVFLLASSVGNLAFPRAAGTLFDEALLRVSEGQVDLARVDRLALILVVIFAATAVASALRFVLFSRAGERIVAHLRSDLYQALMRQEIAFFDTQKTGELSSRLSSDATVLQTTVTSNISMVLRNAVQALGALAMLLVTSARLTSMMLVVVPPVALSAVYFGRRVRKLSKQSQDALAKASEVAVESLSGIRTVRSFAAEDVEVVRYRSAVDRSLELAFRRIKLAGAFFGVAFFAAFSAAVFVFWYGARMVATTELSAGGLISFLFYTMQMSFALSALAELWTDVQRAAGAAERVFELLDRRPAIPPGVGARLSEVRGEVRFSGVGFAYPSRPDIAVLRDFNLVLEPGKVAAIVGPSGAGKSTIASLLYRLYDPQAGTLTLDGRPYGELDPEWLRRQVGVVAQEPLLFSTSIADNIRYGRPGASDAEVEAAARTANAHTFISGFPEGYATLVGERGIQLSGGQKQRVAIARAVLKDPRILILDEATSALDAESEHLVREALERLMRGRTTLVIAHRLSTVKDAHRVVVLDAGQVAQAGTHQSLVAQEGLYRRLVEKQFAA
jgi:ABC transporter fused permease/ATP-binding protein